MSIKIAVVIPAYNAEATIANALESVLGQRQSPDEIIVVDDGSTDATLKVLEGYRNRATVLSQKNQGSAAARQHGSETATADYITYLDADDWWTSGKIEKYKEIVLQERVDCLFGDLQRAQPEESEEKYLPRNSSFFPWVRDYFDGNEAPSAMDNLYVFAPQVALQLLLRGFPMYPSTLLVRRDSLEHIGGWDSRFKRSQDFDLILRLARKFSIHYLDEVHTIVGLHDVNEDVCSYVNMQSEGDIKVLRAHLQDEPAHSEYREAVKKAIGHKYRGLGYINRKSGRYRSARTNYLKSLLYPGKRMHSLVRVLLTIRPG